MKKLEWVTIALIGLLLLYQLALPPFIGIANNGDFERIMNSLGIYYIHSGFEDKFFNHFQDKFWIGKPQEVVYVSTDLILLKIAFWLNQWTSKDNLFDIRAVGLVHAAVFLTGIWLILASIRNLPLYVRGLISVILFVAFCDADLIAYFNSFFSESGSYAFLALLIGSVLRMVGRRKVGYLDVAMFTIFSLLFVGTKSQNCILGIPLALLGYRIALMTKYSYRKMIGAISAVTLFMMSVYVYTATPEGVKEPNVYHAVFFGILKGSTTQEKDLQNLGLDTSLVKYQNTSIFDEGTPRYDPEFREKFFAKIDTVDIAIYYMKHPLRLLDELETISKEFFYLDQGPDFKLGNYTKESGMPSHAQAESFAWWGNVHPKLFPKSIWYVFLCYILFAAFLILRYKKFSQNDRLFVEFLTVLMACAFLQVLVQIVGEGERDISKHLFLFNISFDITLFSGVVYGVYKAIEAIKQYSYSIIKGKAL